MASFPEYYNKKCPLCGGSLKLKEGSYTFQNKYVCEKCSAGYSFVGSKPPTYEEVKQQAQQEAEWRKKQEERTQKNKNNYSQHSIPSTTMPTFTQTHPHPTLVNYIVKLFQPHYYSPTECVPANILLQNYLNNNCIDPNKIISITPCGNITDNGPVCIILVHY